jgi:hypothetical protein
MKFQTLVSMNQSTRICGSLEALRPRKSGFAVDMRIREEAVFSYQFSTCQTTQYASIFLIVRLELSTKMPQEPK